MTVFEAIRRIKECDEMLEWLGYAKTDKDVVLKTHNDMHPNDAAFRKMFSELVIKERARIHNSRVEEL